MSETIILDMWGGEQLRGRGGGMKSPGRILMLDPDGRLMVRDAIDDLEEYEKRTGGEKEDPEDFLDGHQPDGFDGPPKNPYGDLGGFE